jgi:exodeoxyribonuclease VIII
MSNAAIDISNFNEQTEYSSFKGVYDIPIDSYHLSKGISRSGVMEFARTPFHFWNRYLNKDSIIVDQKSQSIKIGRLLHTYILEPEKFHEEYLIVEKRDRRTKEGKMYYDSIEKLGRELITEDDFNQIKLMSESLKHNKQIFELISGAKYEKSIYWNDPHTGLLCKARPDVWQSGFIVDLKTSINAGFREFQRSLYSYGYHIQCAMMYEAFKNVFNIEMRDFIFVVIENTYPFAHAIYKLDEIALEQSIQIFKNKLLEMNQCFVKNEWPSYKTQIITLPTYAIGE